MTNFIDEVVVKASAAIAATGILGAVAYLWRKVKGYYGEASRLRAAILVVLDERRDVLYRKTKAAQTVEHLTSAETEELFRAIILKSRMDVSRDQLWKDAGCPRPIPKKTE